MDYNVILDTNKAWRFGFHEYVDSEEMFLNQFRELQRNNIIPYDLARSTTSYPKWRRAIALKQSPWH